MLSESKAYSGFAVDDAEAAKRFYGETLGLTITEIDADHGLLQLELPGERNVLIYAKGEAHEPAGFTILNFPVADVAATVEGLTEAGVEFERYPGTPMETDEIGVFRGGGPLIAWFRDPAGNVLSVIED